MSETPDLPHSVILQAPVMSALLHAEQAMKMTHEAAQRTFAGALAAVLAGHHVPVGADFLVEPQEDGTGIVRYGDAPTGPQLVTDAEGAE